ncbi:arginine decarboxylase [Halomicrobium zhouii]|uniref:arginine decarboxylase n=1 Tax=Halomicrobium zhouii TaxID=767519 RepID=A0A1I6KF71_9EURY|nr:pyruvoyl-dependent arginine decarboxylase [Halomicrobium zhouii]SFR89895.1 arginine decarboxylase [Halomicrobium zhouii]
MSLIRLVWGAGEGPTELSAFDAALAEAGVHNYNLVTLSSVIPAGPDIEVVGTAPDLGPVGDELHVVESSAVAAPGESVAAGVGWARSESGRGIFYEVDGDDPESVEAEIREGLAAGRELRDWRFVDEQVVVESATATDEYAGAVVCAVYGEGRPAPTEGRGRLTGERGTE